MPWRQTAWPASGLWPRRVLYLLGQSHTYFHPTLVRGCPPVTPRGDPSSSLTSQHLPFSHPLSLLVPEALKQMGAFSWHLWPTGHGLPKEAQLCCSSGAERVGPSTGDQTLPVPPRAQAREAGGVPGSFRAAGLVEVPCGEGSRWGCPPRRPACPVPVFIAKLLSRRGGTGPGPRYLLLYIVYVCDI